MTLAKSNHGPWPGAWRGWYEGWWDFVNHEGKELTELVDGKIIWCQKTYAAGISFTNPLTKQAHPELLVLLGILEKAPAA